MDTMIFQNMFFKHDWVSRYSLSNSSRRTCIFPSDFFFTKDLQLFKNTSILICTYTGPVNWAFVSSLLILIDAFHLCLIDQKAHFHIHI